MFLVVGTLPSHEPGIKIILGALMLLDDPFDRLDRHWACKSYWI